MRRVLTVSGVRAYELLAHADTRARSNPVERRAQETVALAGGSGGALLRALRELAKNGVPGGAPRDGRPTYYLNIGQTLSGEDSAWLRQAVAAGDAWQVDPGGYSIAADAAHALLGEAP